MSAANKSGNHEDEYFPPPRNLRDLIAAVEAAATLTLGSGPGGRNPCTTAPSSQRPERPTQPPGLSGP